MTNVWTSWMNKQAAVVSWLSAPLVWARSLIFQTKQEHNLQKALSFSQSNKYVIVAIFRCSPLLCLCLPKPSVTSLSVSFILSPIYFSFSPFCYQALIDVLTILPDVPKTPKTLHQKAMLPAETMLHTIWPVNWAGNISASHVHIWTWIDLCEKNGFTHSFTCNPSLIAPRLLVMYTLKVCRSGSIRIICKPFGWSCDHSEIRRQYDKVLIEM